MSRKVLPQRRSCNTLALEHDGHRYLATVGYDAVGEVKELFLNQAHLNSLMDSAVRDAAIAVSLALQHGCSLRTLTHAMARNQDGTASSPIGYALDLIGDEK